MGLARFLYDNLITAATMISVSSLRAGMVTAALKNGTGSAVLTPSGDFSGAEDLEYTVEIDSIAGGAEVGQATFKWSDRGGSWDSTGVATAAAATLLNNGVYIAFTTGMGADFVVGDRWHFKGINLFNAERLIDLDRDSRYRSAELEAPNTITIDLGAAQEIEALVIFDHNFTSAATLLLEADDADTFDTDGGSPQLSEAVTWASETILHYLSAATTRQHWRLSVTDAANPDGYIEIGELYLGSYLELSKNFRYDNSEETTFLMETNQTPYGVERDRFYNTQLVFSLDFGMISSADVTALKALISAIVSRSAGTVKPFFFNRDPDVTGDFWLVKIASLPFNNQFMGRYETTLSLKEVVRSV